MDKIELKRRIVYAGDVFKALVENGWNMNTAAALLKKVSNAENAVEVVRCKECGKSDICRTSNTWAVAPPDDWYCADGERKGTPKMTNFERIKKMTIEEMAKMLANEIPHGDCYGCYKCHGKSLPHRLSDSCEDGWLEWLEEER